MGRDRAQDQKQCDGRLKGQRVVCLQKPKQGFTVKETLKEEIVTMDGTGWGGLEEKEGFKEIL